MTSPSFDLQISIRGEQPRGITKQDRGDRLSIVMLKSMLLNLFLKSLISCL